jgi:flagellar biosynthesis/type III secretory pathway protein FliH
LLIDGQEKKAVGGPSHFTRNSLLKEKSMLADSIRTWKEQWYADGKAKGLAEVRAEARAQARAEGWSEGWDEGWEAGLAEAFLWLLTEKFGKVEPEWEKRIRGAQSEAIKIWFKWAFDVSDPSLIFAPG